MIINPAFEHSCISSKENIHSENLNIKKSINPILHNTNKTSTSKIESKSTEP